MRIHKYISAVLIGTVALGAVSCNEFLDRKPYNVSTDAFLKSDVDLFAYSIARYGMFATNGDYNVGANAVADAGTDNQANNGLGAQWIPGDFKVANGTANWDFANIYTCNYFIRDVKPKLDAGTISGNLKEARHSMGEMYFFRAYTYFSRLKAVGDYPIVTRTFPDQKVPLMAASIRQPRNLVARFIMSDLDSALMYMYDKPKGAKNRLGIDAVRLFASRVALYEGTWEKNFAGTAYVPNGPGWTGKAAHPSFQYDNAAEVKFFLERAMKEAKIVADGNELAKHPKNYDYTKNNGTGPSSPYFEMFGTVKQGLDDNTLYKEVLLYRAYDTGVQIAHFNGSYLVGGGATGYTHQFMQSFLMQDGKPYYASSDYLGDDSVNLMKIGRDARMQIFVKGQGDIINDGQQKEPYKVPLTNDLHTPTGYMVKKGISRDPSQTQTGSWGTTGSIIFRATEAYLNYIEACYELNNSLDADAIKYWTALRTRALVSTDLAATDAATNMATEAKNDPAAYAAGKVIEATRYNIRRERRCEFIAEGMRYDDLKRWRAMDQLIGVDEGFMPLGFNLWNDGKPSAIANRLGDKGQRLYYKKGDPILDKDGKPTVDKEGKPIVQKEDELMQPTPSKAGIVSGSTDPYAQGKYMVPLRLNISTSNKALKGMKWHSAHYLNPIGATEFINSSENGISAIYQNPGWATTANQSPSVVGGF